MDEITNPVNSNKDSMSALSNDEEEEEEEDDDDACQ